MLSRVTLMIAACLALAACAKSEPEPAPMPIEDDVVMEGGKV